MSEISNEGVQFDPLMIKLSKFLGKVLEKYQGDGVSFSINDKELEIEDIVSPEGLLHIIAYETSQKAIDVLGKELPVYFYSNEDALCEISPAADSEAKENSFAVWSHISMYTIDEWIKEHKRNLEMETGLKSRPGAPKVIKLDEYYDRFADAGMSGMLRLSKDYKSSNKGLDF